MIVQELASAIREETRRILQILQNTPTDILHLSEDGKWSIAQNAVHLSKSARPVVWSLRVPKFTLRVFGSRSGSRSYNEVVTAYQAKLSEGAKAALPFVPPPSPPGNAGKIAKSMKAAYDDLIGLFSRWTEEELDRYCLPHPIIGKLTMREMLEFTLYHLRHHRSSMESLATPKD